MHSCIIIFSYLSKAPTLFVFWSTTVVVNIYDITKWRRKDARHLPTSTFLRPFLFGLYTSWLMQQKGVPQGLPLTTMPTLQPQKDKQDLPHAHASASCWSCPWSTSLFLMKPFQIDNYVDRRWQAMLPHMPLVKDTCSNLLWNVFDLPNLRNVSSIWYGIIIIDTIHITFCTIVSSHSLPATYFCFPIGVREMMQLLILDASYTCKVHIVMHIRFILSGRKMKW